MALARMNELLGLKVLQESFLKNVCFLWMADQSDYRLRTLLHWLSSLSLNLLRHKSHCADGVYFLVNMLRAAASLTEGIKLKISVQMTFTTS